MPLPDADSAATSPAPAAYRFDERVADLLAAVAVALLDGAGSTPREPADFAAVLLDLEDLRVAATYTEARVEGDQPALCDPAGIAAVTAMWDALTDDLGAAGWEALVAGWRRGRG